MRTVIIPASAGSLGHISDYWPVDAAGCGVRQSAVHLGESGRGRELRVVPVTGLDAGTSRVDHALITERELVGGVRYLTIEVSSASTDDDTLAIVSSSGRYSRTASGTISPLLGATILASGTVAHGDAGRIGSAQECLVQMPVGSALLVCPFGRARAFLAFAIATGTIRAVSRPTDPELLEVDACARGLGTEAEVSAILRDFFGVVW